jgi:fructan beta-fructosidase
VQTPVKELQAIRENPFTITNKALIPNDNLLSDLKGSAFEIVVEFELGAAYEFGFKVRKSESNETIIGYNVEKKKLFLDRTKSGDSSFNDSFAGIHDGELVPKDNKINLHIFVDWSSVEVFGNDGELVLTDLIFPNENSQDLELYAKGGNVTVNSLELYTLKSTWSK